MKATACVSRTGGWVRDDCARAGAPLTSTAPANSEAPTRAARDALTKALVNTAHSLRLRHAEGGRRGERMRRVEGAEVAEVCGDAVRRAIRDERFGEIRV